MYRSAPQKYCRSIRHFPIPPLLGNSARARSLRAFLSISIITILSHGLLLKMLSIDMRVNHTLISALLALATVAVCGAVITKVAQVIGDEMDRAQAECARVEALAEQRRIQMIESSKMSALGEMAEGIAHEINDPLTVIIGNAFLLKSLAAEESVPRERLVSLGDSLEVTAKRIAKIVKGLRSFSRNAVADPFEIIPVREMVEDTVEICLEKFKTHGITLHVENIPEQLALECRPSEINQVLLNLLSNACDAVAKLPERWVRVTARASESHVEISVTDSGPGIPEPVRKQIMKPFFTTKARGKGTGLGLSISRRIVESHGGDFRVDASCPNTRFTALFPKPAENPRGA